MFFLLFNCIGNISPNSGIFTFNYSSKLTYNCKTIRRTSIKLTWFKNSEKGFLKGSIFPVKYLKKLRLASITKKVTKLWSHGNAFHNFKPRDQICLLTSWTKTMTFYLEKLILQAPSKLESRWLNEILRISIKFIKFNNLSS